MSKYVVQTGDTLGTIAARFLGNSSRYTEIAEANSLLNPNQISVGMELTIPTEDPVAVAAAIPSVTVGNENQGLISGNQLKSIMPMAQQSNIDRYLEALNGEMENYAINSPLRMAHFIAQIAHESAALKYSVENLNYSASALRTVFGKYFPTDALANDYARQPQRIASRVYANRMGNGDEDSGEGWMYRGRGLIQLTGKENYRKCGDGISKNLVNNPDQLANDADTAVSASGWYWNSRSLNTYADQDDIETITRKINGGLNGLEDRKAYLTRAKAALGI